MERLVDVLGSGCSRCVFERIGVEGVESGGVRVGFDIPVVVSDGVEIP